LENSNANLLHLAKTAAKNVLAARKARGNSRPYREHPLGLAECLQVTKTDIWPRGSSLRKRRPTKDEMIQWFSRPHRDVAEYLHFWRETNTL
jgi:hypothetical protein